MSLPEVVELYQNADGVYRHKPGAPRFACGGPSPDAVADDNLAIWNRACAEVDPKPKGELRAVLEPSKRGDPRDPLIGGRSALLCQAICLASFAAGLGRALE